MNMLRKIMLAAGMTMLTGFLPAAFANDHFSDDWKISVSGDAESGGVVSFTLTFEPPEDGTAREAITIDTPVAADASENDIADLIANSLAAGLDEDGFDVDVSWGEHVEVKAEDDTPDFVITIANNTLQGVSFEIDD
ncbi:MAG: hypothetical protein OES46_21685 [Gammaproteobacteria bacterium]|nr:hypothetical protein [Gammaproteobacteria bacterium]